MNEIFAEKSAPKDKRPRRGYQLKKNGKKDTGRPAHPPIDLSQVRRLAKFMYTDAEMAAGLRMSETVFKERKSTNVLIQDAINAGRSDFRASLRRKQIRKALAGDDKMLVWLGKQYLGQKEKVEHGHDPDNPPPPPSNVTHNYNFANAEEAAAAFQSRLRSPG